MSKSLTRVTRALETSGAAFRILEMPNETRTAAQAAEAAQCEIDQIAKSMVCAGTVTGAFVLCLTAGGAQVDMAKVAALMGEPCRVPRGDEIRKVTGFAIGGVAPLGHLTPLRAFADTRLLDFDLVWAAAGTPRHVFEIAPRTLIDLIGAEPAAFTSG